MSANYTIGLRQSDNDSPSVPEVIAEITTFLMVAHIMGLILFLITTVKFFFYIPSILRNTPKRFRSRTLLLCGFYSIISASSYTSMMVPRAFLFCDGLTLVTFALTMYQFYCLCLDYAGGELKFIEKANNEKVFTMRTFPFFCCCMFLKPMKITKRAFTILRLTILQLPIALMLIYFVVLVIQMEDATLYNNLSTYILPFMGVSIIISTWGSEMVLNMFLLVLPGFNLKPPIWFGSIVIVPFIKLTELNLTSPTPLIITLILCGFYAALLVTTFSYSFQQKHISVVLVLLFCKMQPLIAQIEFAVNGEQWHQYPITKGIFSNTIIQLLILIQMLLLSIWSHYAYKTPSIKTGRRDSEII